MSKKNSSGEVKTFQLVENSYSIPSLEKLSKADPSNVQQIAASQIELLTAYHNVVLDQAKRSFMLALIASGTGLIFFIAAVSFILNNLPNFAATISLISGALIELIAGVIFYLYSKTSEQLASFQSRLDTTQRFLLANSICEGLEGDIKQKTRSELVSVIANLDISKLF